VKAAIVVLVVEGVIDGFAHEPLARDPVDLARQRIDLLLQQRILFSNLQFRNPRE